MNNKEENIKEENNEEKNKIRFSELIYKKDKSDEEIEELNSLFSKFNSSDEGRTFIYEMLPEKKTGVEKENALNRKEIVSGMLENVNKNEKDILANVAGNNALSLYEYFHNKREPGYIGEGVGEAPVVVGQRMSAEPYLKDIRKEKAAAVRSLRAAGRVDLVPTVLKQARDKAIEVRGSVDAKNMELDAAVQQANLGAALQGIQIGETNRQFNDQMREALEAQRGAAMSENLSNIRDASADALNSMTYNRDNKIKTAMYALGEDDPEIIKSIGAYLNKGGSQRRGRLTAREKAHARKQSKSQRSNRRKEQ